VQVYHQMKTFPRMMASTASATGAALITDVLAANMCGEVWCRYAGSIFFKLSLTPAHMTSARVSDAVGHVNTVLAYQGGRLLHIVA